VYRSAVEYLYHEALDDSVEYHIVIVPVASQSLQESRKWGEAEKTGKGRQRREDREEKTGREDREEKTGKRRQGREDREEKTGKRRQGREDREGQAIGKKG
jgi:phosphatidate phosphatase PAH1